MSVIIKETISVTGECPMYNESVTISVTYRKYHPLGAELAYAIVIGLNCPLADSGCTIEQCPIAHSRVYW